MISSFSFLSSSIMSVRIRRSSEAARAAVFNVLCVAGANTDRGDVLDIDDPFLTFGMKEAFCRHSYHGMGFSY